MALRSEFFLISLEDFSRVLPGWGPAAAMASSATDGVEVVNPFTGERLVLPRSAGAVSAPSLSDDDDVVTSKWTTDHELAELLAAASDVEMDEAIDHVAICRVDGPPDAFGSVHRVPFELVERLAQSSTVEIGAMADRWMSLRGPNALPVRGRDELLELIQQLRALAQTAVSTDREMYLHVGMP